MSLTNHVFPFHFFFHVLPLHAFTFVEIPLIAIFALIIKGHLDVPWKLDELTLFCFGSEMGSSCLGP